MTWPRKDPSQSVAIVMTQFLGIFRTPHQDG